MVLRLLRIKSKMLCDHCVPLLLHTNMQAEACFRDSLKTCLTLFVVVLQHFHAQPSCPLIKLHSI